MADLSGPGRRSARTTIFLVLSIAAVIAVAIALYTSGYRGLRPASGTAVAMSEASAPASSDQRRAVAQ